MGETKFTSAEAAEQHKRIGIPAGEGEISGGNPDRKDWFAKAGLGLFVHFGIASVFGNTDLSWGMIDNYTWDTPVSTFEKITPRRYYKEGSENFTAENYDPEKWLAKAVDAGFKYAVLTTKHHDGYTLWPSKHSEWGVQRSLNGRDLVAPFVNACRKLGLKVGLYYSPPDWYVNREYTNFCGTRGVIKNIDLEKVEQLPKMTWEHAEKYAEKVKAEILDLIDRYDPDILWFDGSCDFPEGFPEPLTPEELLEISPKLIINPRFFARGGDFKTPECKFPEEPIDGLWEMCALLNGHGWGYTIHPYKSLRWFTETLCKIRSWGGNFLANVGPDAAGQLPNDYYVRMKQIREWMKTHREALFDGIEPGGYDKNINVPSTKRGETVYLHILPTEKPECVKVENTVKPKRCSKLSDGTDVPFEFENGTLTINTKDFSPLFTDTVKIEK